ncbi:tRNA methyltransferase 10 homolog A [Cloeon dipterum]|uniref:tRNA methyltransferase 10 homolog A n=1 Tax=Cloeon dipterum TaxID=197152 RepID=UPI00322075E0
MESNALNSDEKLEPNLPKKPKIEEGCSTEEHGEKPVSKSQLKKLKKREHWEKNKLLKRAKEKAAAKEKRKVDRLNGVAGPPRRKELKNNSMASSKCKTSVVVDLSFDDKMDKRSVEKCVKQLLRTYSLNRRAENPMQLYFTSLSGESLSEMKKHQGYQNWDVKITDKRYNEMFAKEKIVYLSSESENVLEKLEEDKVYVIGGLVDHNAHKGLCHNLAVQNGINHAQLPIGEYLHMKSRKVLTIDHVFEILLEVSAGASWKDAFLKIIPKRKGVEEKNDISKDNPDCVSNGDSS